MTGVEYELEQYLADTGKSLGNESLDRFGPKNQSGQLRIKLRSELGG